MAATMGAAVVEGYGEAMGKPIYYYNPTAFMIDSSTRLIFYIVDAATMEVLSIEPYTYGIDVAKEKQLPNLVKIISKYPSIDKK